MCRGCSMRQSSTARHVAKSVKRTLSAHTPVRTAVCIALYGMSQAAYSQQAAMEPTDSLAEVVVTATRRAETLEAVPYSISVVSSDQLTQAGVTDISSLATAVPGLSMYDYGARLAGATVPIIRGINATGEPTRGFRSFEQAPVGTYIGNSPIDGYFQLDDVKQVEVLRGPQGTLYGAGALGGALRIIPNSPELNSFSGAIEASGGYLEHAGKPTYTTTAMFNLPVGETLAVRLAGNYECQPGYINAVGLMERSGPLG